MEIVEISQTAIRCSIMRGGTSRGLYFLADDLPADGEARDQLLLAAMGGPDPLQVDGLGGGHPLTSKVAIVSKSRSADVDVDYLFLQVVPDRQVVSDTQNCGNILAGIGAFAIESGLVEAQDGETLVSVRMLNSDNVCELRVSTPNGIVRYDGHTAIDGVPGTAAAIECTYLDTAGSAAGALLPTGNACDELDGIAVTLIDNGMPVVMLRAADVDCSGYESPDELDANDSLKKRLEEIRNKAGPLMNLGDVKKKSVPKVCLVSPSVAGGQICTRVFIPHVCHKSIGVLGAVTIATACLLPGSVAADIADIPDGAVKDMMIEHPSGLFQVRLRVDEGAPPERLVSQASVVRTARTLMRGEVLVSTGTLHGTGTNEN